MAGLEIGKCRPPLVNALCGRSRGNLRVTLEQARQIPAALVVAHQVDAGFGCAQGGNLESSAEERTKPDCGGNVLCADHRLRAKCGIVVDDEPLKIKARPRQKMKTYVVECDPASKSASDGRGNPVSQPVHAGPEQEQDQQQSRDGSHPAPGTYKFHRTILNVRDQRVSSKK